MQNHIDNRPTVTQDDDRKTLFYVIFALGFSALLIGGLLLMWSI